MPTNKWIQGATPKKGALKRQLGYSPKDELPKGLLNEIYDCPVGNKCRGRTVTRLLKRRVVFAINAQKRRR